MNEQQFQTLLDYISARISEKIDEAYGSNSMANTVRRNDLEEQLRKILVTETEKGETNG